MTPAGSRHTIADCINVCIPKEHTSMGNNRERNIRAGNSNVPTFVQKMSIMRVRPAALSEDRDRPIL